MTYSYYYTPCYDGPILDADTGEPTSANIKQPAPDSGSGPEYIAFMPNGSYVLKDDDAQSRCVVRLPDFVAPMVGWTKKTSGEVLTDYPGLHGVI